MTANDLKSVIIISDVDAVSTVNLKYYIKHPIIFLKI